MDFDFESAYIHPSYKGVAFRATEHAKTYEDVEYEFTCFECDEGYIIDSEYENEECGYCDGNGYYIDYDVEEVEVFDRVVCHMIGDDREFEFEIDELEKIDEPCSCGQVGCGWF